MVDRSIQPRLGRFRGSGEEIFGAARGTFPLPTSTYSALGGLRQDPEYAAQSPAEMKNTRWLGDSQHARVVVDVGFPGRCRAVGGAGVAVAGARRRGRGGRA